MPQTVQKYSMGGNALIALGSNVTSHWGIPNVTLQKAFMRLTECLGGSAEMSRVYTTPAFPVGAGPDFANAAIRVETNLSALKILEILHEIEAEAGRERLVRWGQRTLDLDLIALDDVDLPDRVTHDHWRGLSLEKQAKVAPDQLILPHPRVQDRSFVLVPLADVAPDWVHPIIGLTTAQMRDARPLDELATVRPI